MSTAIRENVGVLGLEGVLAVPLPPGPARDAFGPELLINTPPGTYPRFNVTRIGGLFSKPDSAAPAQPNMGMIGETPQPDVPRGKTLTYEGELEARSLVELRRAQRAFRAAFAPRRLAEFRVYPLEAYLGGTEHTFVARCESADCDDEQTSAPTRQPSPFVRAFSIGLRQFDPRYYQAGAHDASGDPAVGVQAINDGIAPTDPVIVLTGPTPEVAWRIARDGADGGRFLELPAAAALGDADTATFDFGARMITRASDGADLRPLLTLASDWWDAGVDGLEPGLNLITATGGSDIAVAWLDASW